MDPVRYIVRGNEPSAARDRCKRPDHPARALRCGARWIGSAISLVSVMLGVAALAQAQPTERAPDTMEARLRACEPCHGRQGGGTNDDYFPRLAGKPAGYLMNHLLEYLPDAYLQKIAEYFAALRPLPAQQTATDVGSAVLARGRSLVTDGDQARGVPACSGCHGPKLTGMEPGIPGLVGLRKTYISAQLGAFRYGTRTAAKPDCMQLVAAGLTESDVTAVAAWLASLPIPADPSPCHRGHCRCRSAAAANQTERGGLCAYPMDAIAANPPRRL